MDWSVADVQVKVAKAPYFLDKTLRRYTISGFINFCLDKSVFLPSSQQLSTVKNAEASNLYNKRACPHTMFTILHLRKQHCQIKRITGLPKPWGRERKKERELKIKIWGGGGDTETPRVGPTRLK